MSDIKNYLAELFSDIDSNSTVAEAAIMMKHHETTALLVTEKKEYVGIVTDVDFTRKIIAEGVNPTLTLVSQVMTRPIISLDHHQSMEEIILCMRKNKIRHVLIKEEGEYIGLITVKGIANYCWGRFRFLEDPIKKFWDNYEYLIDENSFRQAIDGLLKESIQTLPPLSQTVTLIKENAPLLEIVEQADNEGYKELARALRLGLFSF